MEIRVVKNNFRPFREIATGEVFMYDNEHYMRTEVYKGWSANAVNLFTGELTFFHQDDKILPVKNCHLAIEEM